MALKVLNYENCKLPSWQDYFLPTAAFSSTDASRKKKTNRVATPYLAMVGTVLAYYNPKRITE